MLLHDEIFEQPARLEGVLNTNQGVTARARDILTGSDIHHVVIAARGTSDNAARYAKYVWADRLGLPVTLADLSDVVVPLHAGEERSVAAAKTYTTSLMAIAMIAGNDEALMDVPAVVAATLELEVAIERAVTETGPIDKAAPWDGATTTRRHSNGP